MSTYSSQPPVGSPPFQGQPPPQSGSRWRWLWILLAILVLIVLLIGGCSFLVFNATRGPIDATNAYVADIDNGDLDSAYSSLCSRLQASTPIAEWTEGLNARMSGGEITDFNFNTISVTNSSATVTGTIEIDGRIQFSAIALVSEGDSWRVCSTNPLG